jgi:hypothetical protein
MTSKLSTWLLLALAGGAFVAGCGSSSNSTSSSQSTPTVTTTAPPVTPLTPAQAKKAVSSCKGAIQRQSTIPKSARGTLEKTCEKAASSGSPAALGQVAEEACVDLINASHLPSGVIKDRALATCKVNSSVGR